jgi:hypothetical protein
VNGIIRSAVVVGARGDIEDSTDRNRYDVVRGRWGGRGFSPHASEVVSQSRRRVFAPLRALLVFALEDIANTKAVEADAAITDIGCGLVDQSGVAYEVVIIGHGIGNDGWRGRLGCRSSSGRLQGSDGLRELGTASGKKLVRDRTLEVSPLVEDSVSADLRRLSGGHVMDPHTVTSVLRIADEDTFEGTAAKGALFLLLGDVGGGEGDAQVHTRSGTSFVRYSMGEMYPRLEEVGVRLRMWLAIPEAKRQYVASSPACMVIAATMEVQVSQYFSMAPSSQWSLAPDMLESTPSARSWARKLRLKDAPRSKTM